jgi:hypothetical protein
MAVQFGLLEERGIHREACDLICRIVGEIKIGEFGDFARPEDDDPSRLQSRRLVYARRRSTFIRRRNAGEKLSYNPANGKSMPGVRAP